MTAAVLLARRPARVRPYAAIAATALRQARAERAATLGRLAFMAVLLLIFSRLWQVVAERGGLPGVSDVEMLWYLAITEWVMLSLPLLHLEIERDIRSGDIACRLARPLSYLGQRLAEASGEAALRGITLGIGGAAIAWALTGGLPHDPRGLLLALPLVVLATALGLLSLAAIGLVAFWIQDCSPVYWIWQKAAFVLGGLLLPLEIYPDWLRQIALATPFSALMYGPGRMAFGWDPAFAATVALKLVFWLAVTVLLLVWLYRRALRVLDVNGG